MHSEFENCVSTYPSLHLQCPLTRVLEVTHERHRDGLDGSKISPKLMPKCNLLNYESQKQILFELLAKVG